MDAELGWTVTGAAERGRSQFPWVLLTVTHQIEWPLLRESSRSSDLPQSTRPSLGDGCQLVVGWRETGRRGGGVWAASGYTSLHALIRAADYSNHQPLPPS